MEKTFKDLNGKPMSASDKKQASLAERAKFQFEADSEDDEMENEIDSNLDALGGAAARLNGLARATGKEVDEQNRHLERINQKSSRVDDEVCSVISFHLSHIIIFSFTPFPLFPYSSIFLLRPDPHI